MTWTLGNLKQHMLFFHATPQISTGSETDRRNLNIISNESYAEMMRQIETNTRQIIIMRSNQEGVI